MYRLTILRGYFANKSSVTVSNPYHIWRRLWVRIAYFVLKGINFNKTNDQSDATVLLMAYVHDMSTIQTMTPTDTTIKL